jgi:hypothetical protein
MSKHFPPGYFYAMFFASRRAAAKLKRLGWS